MATLNNRQITYKSSLLSLNASLTTTFNFLGLPQSPRQIPVDADVGTTSDFASIDAPGLVTFHSKGVYFIRWSFNASANLIDAILLNNEMVYGLEINSLMQTVYELTSWGIPTEGELRGFSFSTILPFDVDDTLSVNAWTLNTGGDNCSLIAKTDPATTTTIPAFDISIYRLWD